MRARAGRWRAEADKTRWSHGLPYRLRAGPPVTMCTYGEFHSTPLPVGAQVRVRLTVRHSFGEVHEDFAVRVPDEGRPQVNRERNPVMARFASARRVWRLLFNTHALLLDSEAYGAPVSEGGPAESANARRIRLLRHRIGFSLKEVFGCALAAVVAAWCLGYRWVAGRSDWIRECAGALAAVVLCWAVLGLLGWEVQSIGGTTLPEQTNQKWFRFLTLFGTGLLIFSLAHGMLWESR